ncbi:MAG TPA: hypothetical protein VEX68_22710 [Bryobacteraceae bacterium]|nr:hypothetical protein [Bryobacteraceae bacterium]
MTRRTYVVGLDLGQKRDYSAVAVLELAQTIYEDRRDPVTYDFVREECFRLVYLERVELGTPYPDVVEHVAGLVADERLADCTLVVDATGVGAPVVDLLKKAKLPCRLMPVMITGGSHDRPGPTGGYHVPRRELLTGLQVLFDEGRLQIARRMPMAEALVRELTGFKAGSRDDLVLATALAWWWARKNEAWRGGVGRVC